MFKQLLKKLSIKYPIIKAILNPLIVFRRYLKKTFGMQGTQNKLINNIREILVGDVIIWVKEFQGKFYIDPHSDIFHRIAVAKSYESELVKLSLKYTDKNKDMIDVGANIGFYSVLFAKILKEGNKVVSIEPTKSVCERLRRNLVLNQINNKIDVFEGAVSNNNDSAIIEIIEGKEEYSSLGGLKNPIVYTHRDKISKYKVECVTIDTLVKEKSLNPGFIKVDVEGSEYLVFQGAHKTLSENRPIILSEVCELLLKKAGHSVKDVIQLIQTYDYDVFDVQKPLVPVGENTNNYPNESYILCFPKELKVKTLK